MGVYINMEMPKSCYDCRFEHYEGHGVFVCKATMKTLYNDDEVFKPWKRRMENCPLIHVPPHGRLIDADALDNVLSSDARGLYGTFLMAARRAVYAMPTIIEAEEGER